LARPDRHLLATLEMVSKKSGQVAIATEDFLSKSANLL